MQEHIEQALDEVRPFIEAHGGALTLLSYEEGVVRIWVQGTCVGCAMAELTYNNLVDGLLRERVPDIKEIYFEYS